LAVFLDDTRPEPNPRKGIAFDQELVQRRKEVEGRHPHFVASEERCPRGLRVELGHSLLQKVATQIRSESSELTIRARELSTKSVKVPERTNGQLRLRERRRSLHYRSNRRRKTGGGRSIEQTNPGFEL